MKYDFLEYYLSNTNSVRIIEHALLCIVNGALNRKNGSKKLFRKNCFYILFWKYTFTVNSFHEHERSECANEAKFKNCFCCEMFFLYPVDSKKLFSENTFYSEIFFPVNSRKNCFHKIVCLFHKSFFSP